MSSGGVYVSEWDGGGCSDLAKEDVNRFSIKVQTSPETSRGHGSEMASEALNCCHTLHVHGRYAESRRSADR